MPLMTPKEIGRVADGVFRTALPSRWITRSQQDQEDYGIDYEIELATADDQATGFLFKVQQKGVEHATILADGKTLSYSDLTTEKLAYYLRQLRIPVIFAVVDITSKRTYWIPLHGNRDVADRLAAAERAKQKTLTLHIPTANTLPATEAQLLASVRDMMNFLTLESLKEMSAVDAQAVIASEPDLAAIERSLHFAQAVVRSEKTQRLIDEKRLVDALKLNAAAFRADHEPIESRFTSGMEMVRVAGGIVATQPGTLTREDLLRLRLHVFHELVSMTRPLPPSHALRHYSIFLARISRLRVAIDHDFGLFMAQQAQKNSTDPFADMVMAGAYQPTRIRIIRELRAAQRRIVAMLANNTFGFTVYAWAELTETLTPFLVRLKEEGLTAGADALRHWLDEVGLVCRHLATAILDDHAVALAALNHVRVGFETESQDARMVEAKALIARIKSDTARTQAVAALDRLAELSAVPPESDSDAEVDIEPAIRQMARALGIDVDDPDDEIAHIVRVGIRDFNPERILRDCNHLMTEIGSYGIPARMLGLPTAGTKNIHCLKHGYAMAGFELDKVYPHFKADYCNKCPNREARPEGWRWSVTWHDEAAIRAFGPTGRRSRRRSND